MSIVIQMNEKLETSLLTKIKTLKGSLITVGIDDIVIIQKIKDNKNINRSYNLEKGYKKFTRKQEKEGYKNLRLSQLKRQLKTKVDYILCDVNGINTYLSEFINASYNIVSKEIIFYGVYNEYDVDRIIKKYKRFNVTIKKEIYQDSFLLIINMKKVEIKKRKLFYYRFTDFFADLYNSLSDMLMQ